MKERLVDPVDLYFVASGDTYPAIAKLKSVDLKQLRRINNGGKLKVGQILWIPPAIKNQQDNPRPQKPTAEQDAALRGR